MKTKLNFLGIIVLGALVMFMACGKSGDGGKSSNSGGTTVYVAGYHGVDESSGYGGRIIKTAQPVTG